MGRVELIGVQSNCNVSKKFNSCLIHLFSNHFRLSWIWIRLDKKLTPPNLFIFLRGSEGSHPVISPHWQRFIGTELFHGGECHFRHC
jgi:hypothetical protein